MGDSQRLTTLLGKSKAGRLTPTETTELARLLSEPILPRPDAPVFVSRRPFVSTDVANRLQRIDWFDRCGAPLICDVSMTVEQPGSWIEALEHATSEVWADVRLEAQNQLTSWLDQHDRPNYQSWNARLVGYNTTVLEPLTREKWVPYRQAHGLSDVLASAVQWDIRGALMENSYLTAGHTCTFFLELLTVYETGHFPCGWQGPWPGGTLLVF